MMYVELFRQKYHGSEITCTHFSLSVKRVIYAPTGEQLHYPAHSVLLYVDNDKRMFVFDGNIGNSLLFEVWYARVTEKYMEILNVSVAMIPYLSLVRPA